MDQGEIGLNGDMRQTRLASTANFLTSINYNKIEQGTHIMTDITRRAALTLLGGVALATPFVRRARAEGTLNVYNWADYIGETTIDDFQTATGIAVTYDNYASAEEMQAKMLAGSTGYDVVDHAGLSLPSFIKARVYERLDKSKLPNWSISIRQSSRLSMAGIRATTTACPTCGARSA